MPPSPARIVDPHLGLGKHGPDIGHHHATRWPPIQPPADERLPVSLTRPYDPVTAREEPDIHRGREIGRFPVVVSGGHHEVRIIRFGMLVNRVRVVVDLRPVHRPGRQRGFQVQRIPFQGDQRGLRPGLEVGRRDPANGPIPLSELHFRRLVPSLGLVHPRIADVEVQAVIPEEDILGVAHLVGRIRLALIIRPMDPVG